MLLAEKSLLITDRVAAQMRRQGMTVATVPGTGHTVFRDDHAGFMHAVTEWLRGVAPAAVGTAPAVTHGAWQLRHCAHEIVGVEAVHA